MLTRPNGSGRRIAGAGLTVLLAALMLLAFGGPVSARDQAIYNVDSHRFPASVEQRLSLQQIGEAIMTAGHGRNASWVYRRLGEGQINAELFIRKHWARVLIRFDSREFSISYVDSKLLRYRGSTIHRNYNKWIRNLENDIVVAVSRRAQSD